MDVSAGNRVPSVWDENYARFLVPFAPQRVMVTVLQQPGAFNRSMAH